MTDDRLAPEVHQGQGVLYNADNSINEEALPIEPSITVDSFDERLPDVDYGAWGKAAREEKDAANAELLDIHKTVTAKGNNLEVNQQTALTDINPEDERTASDGKLTQGDLEYMCETACFEYFGVHTQAFAENFDFWVSEYEKESSDRVYKNKIWLVTKLIYGDPILKASVANQVKLEEIAGRL